MTRYLPIVALALSSGCAFGAHTGGVEASASAKTIRIKDFAFAPPEVIHSAGDTIVWLNTDGFTHSATSDSGAWSSPELMPGERFVLVAPQPGRYPYHCGAHPTMRGVLLIR